MIHQGNAEAGRKLFFEAQRLACSQCHTVDSRGGKAGPDLFAIGDKFGRDELIQSILEPSATIAVGYSTTTIRTRSGDFFQGIIKEASEQGVGLMGADGKLVRIRTQDIDRQQTTDVSLMPEGLEASLSFEEFADLIAYLASLKAPQNTAVAYHGMPPVIPQLQTPVRLVPFIAPEHQFQHPVWFGPVPGLPDAFAIVEHESGKIWLIRKNGSDETKTLFLDTGKFIRGTRGLLGLVFHPNFAINRRYFYVKHLAEGGHFATHLFEGKASEDLGGDSGTPPREILKFDAVTNVHYGGGLAFGPDGCLYMSMGDSGPQGDPEGHAQNLSLPLGKIHRFDVDHPESGKLYSVPKDNPFVGAKGALPTIWSYGLREPWRISFDPVTGDLWAGDVGQDLYEEVDIIRRGENYGWNVYEGFERFSNKYRREGEHFVPPVFAYTRKYGQSVTGGFVYRGDRNSSFFGVYLFGDWQKNRLFALTQKDRVLDKVRQIGICPQQVVSFGRDNAGELYVVGYQGMIYKIELSATRFE
ncbi:MAG TPA: PQQ-dependent sugar dehydrogenase [Tepidisphaeraceae bacterium]|nr:PQQ-dependent sugar dehydrogenase [Tepidisphaeraceae bacterium]